MKALARVFVVLGTATIVAAPLAARADDPAAAGPEQAPAPAQPQPSDETQGQPKLASEQGDITQIIGEALDGVNLKPEQSDAIERIAAQVDAKVGAVDEAKRELLLSLADQIAAGHIDVMALHPEMERFVDAATEAGPVVRRGLEKLHDTLDPEQRKQFADNLRAVLAKHESEEAGTSRLDELSKTLNLSDEQRQKIASILEQRKDERKVAKDVALERAELILAAFPGEDFSLDDLVPEGAVTKRAAKLVAHIVRSAEEITPILTEQQREKAAKMIRDRVSENPDHVSQSLVAARGGVAVRGGGWAARGYRVSTGYGVYRGYAGYGYRGGYGGMWLI